jgi:hypothetical protein
VPSTLEKLKELRLNRMRLGKALGYVEQLPSQPEIKVALLPLTEAEHLQCLEIVTSMEVPETVSGAMSRDRRTQNEVLLRSLRDPDNLDEPLFSNLDEMTENLEIVDVGSLYDAFLEMSESVNPSPGQYTDEEVDEIKKVFLEIPWNELSGRQWYALRRFLLTIGKTLLPANSLGSISTNSVIMTNEDEKFTQDA